jgi:hypothetical protein
MHRQVAVFKNGSVDAAQQRADVGSPPSEELLRLCCVICEDDNVFDLAMETVNDGRNPEKHFCRYDRIKLQKLGTEDCWVPFNNAFRPFGTVFENIWESSRSPLLSISSKESQENPKLSSFFSSKTI